MFLSNPFTLYIITDIYERFSQRSRFFTPFLFLHFCMFCYIPTGRCQCQPPAPGTLAPTPFHPYHTPTPRLQCLLCLSLFFCLLLYYSHLPIHLLLSLPLSLSPPTTLFVLFFFYFGPFNPTSNPSPSIVVSRTV